MQLPLHQILPSEPVRLHAQHIDDTGGIIASVWINHNDSGYSLNDDYDRDHSELRLHSIYPLSLLRVSKSAPKGVVAVYPYGSSNLYFLRMAENTDDKEDDTTSIGRIILWDDKNEKIVLELGFTEPVKGLCMRRDKLVVVCRNRVILYHLDFDNKDRAEAIIREGAYETADNPLGLATIATRPGSSLLAFPGRQLGHVQLVRLPPLSSFSAPSSASPIASASSSVSKSTPPYPSIHIYLAHASPLRTLTLSQTGSLLCTSSSKGTLLRVFSTSGSRNLLRELRRGTDQADVWSICFLDPDKGEQVACASDKRTIHIWQVGDLTSTSAAGSTATSTSRAQHQHSSSHKGKGREQQIHLSSGGSSTVESATKALKYLKPYLPAYFSSQWSDLTWRIPHNASTTFHPAHVAVLAEQDDIATCLWIKLDKEKEMIHSKGRFKKQRLRELDNDSHHLLVITRSGAYFRLSMQPNPPPIPSSSSEKSARKTKESAKLGSRTTHREQRSSSGTNYQKDHSPSRHDSHKGPRPPTNSARASVSEAKEGTGKSTDEKKCRLVEYKRLGYGSEGEHGIQANIDDDESELEFDSDSSDEARTKW